MTDRDRLIELLNEAILESDSNYGMPHSPQMADILIANGVTVNDWRPASEPPTNGEERVAVFLKSGFTDHIGINRIDTDRYLGGRWVLWGKFVTHWRPLPQPPKEVE